MGGKFNVTTYKISIRNSIRDTILEAYASRDVNIIQIFAFSPAITIVTIFNNCFQSTLWVLWRYSVSCLCNISQLNNICSAPRHVIYFLDWIHYSQSLLKLHLKLQYWTNFLPYIIYLVEHHYSLLIYPLWGYRFFLQRRPTSTGQILWLLSGVSKEVHFVFIF